MSDHTGHIPNSVVFAGDSITDAGRTSQGGLGDGYVSMLAAGALASSTVINVGVPGDRVVDLVARWERDVLANAAQMVSIYVGINDTGRRYDSGSVTTLDEFVGGYRRLLAPLAAGGVRVVLVEPFVLPVTPDQRRWAEDLDPKRQAVADLSEEFGALFVPLAAPLAEVADRIGSSAVAADGVHPTTFGHGVIADAWWSVVSSAGQA